MTLRGYNAAGDGPSSKPLVFNTKEGIPGPPQHVKYTSFGKYIRMRWEPPKMPNGVIIGYAVKINNGEWKDLEQSKMDYLFRNLKPEREYEVYITAKNSAGRGETVVKLVNTTLLRGI